MRIYISAGSLLPVFDPEVVEQGFEVVPGYEACIKQEAFDAGPFTEASIVEYLQFIGDDERDNSSR